MSLLVKRYRASARPASPRVRFGPKTDLIPTPNAVAHASRLCNRAEEYAHAGSSECDRRIQASAMEQGKVDRGKAAAATQTRLVDPDKAPDRGPRSRAGHVQSG